MLSDVKSLTYDSIVTRTVLFGIFYVLFMFCCSVPVSRSISAGTVLLGLRSSLCLFVL